LVKEKLSERTLIFVLMIAFL